MHLYRAVCNWAQITRDSGTNSTYLGPCSRKALGVSFRAYARGVAAGSGQLFRFDRNQNIEEAEAVRLVFRKSR